MENTHKNKTSAKAKEKNEAKPMNKRALGRQFEELAAKYLEEKGYKILARGYRSRHGEIDLIAEDHGTIVFCEVKYRSGKTCGTPLEAVGRAKMANLIYTARYYLYRNGFPEDQPCRFDVIGMTGGRLTHVKDAFQTS